MPTPVRIIRRGMTLAALAGAGMAAASAAGSVGAAAYLARRLLTPERDLPDNVVIVAAGQERITLSRTEESVLPGRYGLWLDHGVGHLRMGQVLADDPRSGVVTRVLEGVDAGVAAPGPARWNSYYYGMRPEVSLGLPTTDVAVSSDIGLLPAWLIPGRGAPSDGSSGRWAVLLHGRGGEREECLRAVPTLHRMGITVLTPMYRNDHGAPPSPDGRYNLGLSEWRDAEAAVRFAVGRGAKDVVLMGWSMGGAIALQMLDQSELACRVGSVVLNAPVIDWGHVIRHHAELHRVPAPLSALTTSLIGAPWARRLVGVRQSLDVAQTNWEDRSDELNHRMLIIHSADDDFVPIAPAQALAARRPDLVRLEAWSGAGHTKEWNTDPGRWEYVVTDFLAG